MKKLLIVALVMLFSNAAFAGSVKDRLERAKTQKGNKTSASESLRTKRVQRNRVEFYMTSWCPYCRKMESFMRKNNIKFIKYDIEKNGAAHKRYKAMKGEGVPLLKVNGKIIRGYDPEGLLWALD